MTRRLPHLRQQLKNDNRGASLVTVMVIASLVIIMVTVLLSVVLLNFYMKKQNNQSQENFYSAETAMEEIRMGLVTEVSKAVTISYTNTLTNYNDLTEMEKTEHFRKIFLEQLQDQLKENNNKQLYSRDLLTSFLKEEGAKLETPGDGVSNALNDMSLEAGDRCLVLKNVIVSYTDEQDNYTQIATDIDLCYPDIDFARANAMDNILCYAMIAGEHTVDKERLSFVTQNNNVDTEIRGNVYLGTGITSISKGSKLSFASGGSATGYVIGADVKLDNADVSVEGMETWLQNIKVSNHATFDTKKCDSYLQNDLVLDGAGTKATMSGSLYAFGNPEAMAGADCYEVERIKGGSIKDAMADNVADFSSSVIVNGRSGTKLDLSRLQNLMIAGTSYINTKKHHTEYTHGNSNASVATGQSVMTTSDQRAYLVPGELLGANPMPAKDYQDLKASIMESKGYTHETQIKSTDLVDFDASIPGMGVSLNQLGVKSIQTSAIQVNGAGSIYYFFLQFEDQAKRNDYAKKYGNRNSKWEQNVNTYAPQGIELPNPSSNPLSFYLEGNALSTKGGLIVSDTLEKKTEDLLRREKGFADSYAGLLANLTKDYKTLTDKQKAAILFDNIMKEEDINGITEYYVSTNGIGAVVTAEDISVSTAGEQVKRQSVKDKDENSHDDATINLIISKGDVTVDGDFEGLIFCGGTIKLTPGCKKITQDSQKAGIALFQSQNKDGKYPGQYLENENYYSIGGTSDPEGEDDGTVRLLDFVTYSNWEKH